MFRTLMVMSVIVIGISVAAAAATKRPSKWAVVNYHGQDVWLVSPDGAAHAIPPGCRGQARLWREGDKNVETPVGAYKWETIPLPHGAGKELLRKEKVSIGDRDYYCRHFTTR
jgi:hypothetical protein